MHRTNWDRHKHCSNCGYDSTSKEAYYKLRKYICGICYVEEKNKLKTKCDECSQESKELHKFKFPIKNLAKPNVVPNYSKMVYGNGRYKTVNKYNIKHGKYELHEVVEPIETSKKIAAICLCKQCYDNNHNLLFQ